MNMCLDDAHEHKIRPRTIAEGCGALRDKIALWADRRIARYNRNRDDAPPPDENQTTAMAFEIRDSIEELREIAEAAGEFLTADSSREKYDSRHRLAAALRKFRRWGIES